MVYVEVFQFISSVMYFSYRLASNFCDYTYVLLNEGNKLLAFVKSSQGHILYLVLSSFLWQSQLHSNLFVGPTLSIDWNFILYYNKKQYWRLEVPFHVHDVIVFAINYCCEINQKNHNKNVFDTKCWNSSSKIIVHMLSQGEKINHCLNFVEYADS